MYPSIVLFGKTFSSYTVTLALGIVVGALYALFTRRRYALSAAQALLGVFYLAFGSVFGARLMYVFVHWQQTLAAENLLQAFLKGGFTFYGGMICGVLMLLLNSRVYRIRFTALTDTLAPCAALGHAIGRVGCYLGGCCYGRETDSFLGVVFPEGCSAPAGVPLLPVQLFEAAFLLALCAALTVILLRSRRRGFTTGVYLSCYAVWRFCIEFIRCEPKTGILGLTVFQLLSFLILAAGALFLVYARKRGTKA